MLTIPFPADLNANQLQIELRQKYNIEIPLISWNGMNLIRISVQGYNTEQDIDALVSAFSEFLKKGKSQMNFSSAPQEVR